ncbi:THY1 Predicted alternative thymidylate synthase [uncultured Caudovirales phage]|uniref:THY1 Predicted alternative thymidylate synthase n=1 Tax=uncultured Caudovirales phage TaxID=2100421 RepID=A0A6J7WUX0_9CAUD|nr:THY1 Predicted alternative thymidylate synthase [uncultured Caudovirales phage]
MNARIVALTQPIISNDGNVGTDAPLMTVDEFVAYVARVSNPGNQTNTLTAAKLLKYLAKHKHWSPFEMVHIVMEINTTRDIGRQILRHRSFTFQEFSQRYADATRDLGFSHREARLQDTKNRQNSVEVNDPELQREWDNKQAKMIGCATEAYTWAINNGIAKEQARAVLPEGLTNSRLYMTGSLRSWIHYCQLRAANGTQKEHREIAIDCWYQLMKHFPCLEDIGLISE